jgi:hypothetical protein
MSFIKKLPISSPSFPPQKIIPFRWYSSVHTFHFYPTKLTYFFNLKSVYQKKLILELEKTSSKEQRANFIDTQLLSFPSIAAMGL